MCHPELCPIQGSHLFSFLKSSSGLARGKYYRQTIIPIFGFCFPICCIFRQFFLDCFVNAVRDALSVRE